MAEVSVAVLSGFQPGVQSPGPSRTVLWLRVIATFLVVLYHGVRFFDETAKDISLQHAYFPVFFESFSRFVTQWHMPLFFLLAGYSVRLSLGKVSYCSTG
jgi:hypothetical protein